MRILFFTPGFLEHYGLDGPLAEYPDEGDPDELEDEVDNHHGHMDKMGGAGGPLIGDSNGLPVLPQVRNNYSADSSTSKLILQTTRNYGPPGLRCSLRLQGGHYRYYV